MGFVGEGFVSARTSRGGLRLGRNEVQAVATVYMAKYGAAPLAVAGSRN